VIFTETRLPGAFTIDVEPHDDERGFFARIWDSDELSAHGLDARIAQASIAYNNLAGTLRGLHFQAPPHAETKLVRCTRGAIWDVIVDIRSDSATFLEWIGVELSADNRRTLYVPEEFAHGYQTLTEASEVAYQMSTPYVPEAARGLRWDDPRLAIEWPAADARVISDRDRAWPDIEDVLAALA
jgi:dTDP-4-dehydrorhamnose 3,5-epimerase